MTSLGELIGDSPEMVSIREQIRRLVQRQPGANRLPPILILGETGTGKGLVAHAIHAAGPRAEGPFVQVNSAALPETLLEAELFGFEKGAFTGARHAKPGLFQVAARGTLFLDELGRLSLTHQAKLLKAVEQRTIRRLGGTRDEPVDAWIVAASSDDLLARTREGRFRRGPVPSARGRVAANAPPTAARHGRPSPGGALPGARMRRVRRPAQDARPQRASGAARSLMAGQRPGAGESRGASGGPVGNDPGHRRDAGSSPGLSSRAASGSWRGMKRISAVVTASRVGISREHIVIQEAPQHRLDAGRQGPGRRRTRA